MTSIACKVTLNNETRRVLLESTRDTTFNKLNQVVRELFNQKLPSIYTLVIFYILQKVLLYTNIIQRVPS